MPITTFEQIRGTDVNAVVARMASEAVDASQARALLEGIKTELRAQPAREGILRIRSGKGEADASLSLVRARRWRLFGTAHSSQRLDTGRAIEALLKKSGANADTVKEFERYREARGSRGLEAHVVRQFLELDEAKIRTADSLDGVHRKLGLELGKTISQGSFGRVRDAQHGGATVLKQIFKSHDLQPFVNGKLDRAQEGAAATFAKNVPGLITPSLFIVKTQAAPPLPARADRAQQEDSIFRAVWGDVPGAVDEGRPVPDASKQPPAAPKYHAVPADKRFREWAHTQQAAGSTAQIVETVMPRACGPALNAPQASGARAEVPSAIWSQALNHGLQTLAGLARHGFVHGDIKPGNLCMDRQTGQLQIIDTDGMLKRHKANPDDTTAPVHGITWSYTLPQQPLANSRQGRGLDHDAFGLGLSILTCSLSARGLKDTEQRIQNAIHGFNQRVDAKIYSNKTDAELRTFLKNSLDDFLELNKSQDQRTQNLTPAELEAYEVVKKALAQPQPVLMRHVPGQADHPLADLYQPRI